MDRRKSLKVIALSSISAELLLQSCKGGSNKESPVISHQHEHNMEGSGSQTPEERERDKLLLKEKFFTDHEYHTITILGNLIIPTDEYSGNAEEAHVPEFIEFMMKDQPFYQTPMRGGLRWLDMECLKRYDLAFVNCSEPQQKEILDGIAYPHDAEPELIQGVGFFNLLRGFVATGFFTSKIGIEDLGYQGNVAHIWDGAPQNVLDSFGLKYDEKTLQQCVRPEDRDLPMDWN